MFNAFRVFDENGTISGRIVQVSLDELSAGAVVIKAAYSSVNYKDALAATGAGKIMRRFPLVGGIDVAGTVESSADARFKTGDQVLVTGYDLGVAHDGGYAAYARVPAEWVVPLPGWPVPLRRDGHRHRGIHGGAVDRRDGAERSGAIERPRHRDRRDWWCRQYRDSVVGGPRLLRDGADRQGARSRLPAHARCDERPDAGLARDGHAAAREVDVGRRRRSSRRRRARVADANDDVWRLHREFRADRRHRPQDDGVTVHPAWRETARDRFGDVPGRDAPRGVAAPRR